MPLAACAGSLLGVLALLGATALITSGVARLSTSVAQMPALLHASAASVDPRRGYEADRAARPARIAEGDRAARLAMIRNAREDRFVHRSAAIDPQRFAAVPLPVHLRQASAPVTVASLEPQAQQMAEIPLPRPRPQVAEAPAANDEAPQVATLPAPDVTPNPRPEHAARKKQGHDALAYASPDDGAGEEKPGGIFGRLFGGSAADALPGRASKVAVYDIGSATVYLPNGDKLEAHSGLAHMQDNPRYVTQKNRGPTPPNLYNLVMRESRFHGVEAIRLLPADGRKKYNRDGLLAHTYMYAGGGSRSQSNGCVVFKRYERFLNAFKRGEIERLIVVPSMKELPTYVAAL